MHTKCEFLSPNNYLFVHSVTHSFMFLLELDHAQSLERQDHYFYGPQTHRSQNYYASPLESVSRVARRAADEMQRFSSDVYEGARSAYQKTQQLQRHHQHYPNRRSQTSLQDFGFSNRQDPLLGDAEEALLQSDHLPHELDLEASGLDQPAQHYAYNQSTANSATATTTASHSTNNKDNNPSSDFILLSQFHQTQPSWGTVPNLDRYFTSLYSFYYHRGWIPILGKHIVESFTLVGTLGLSLVLMVHLDWKLLAQCTDEHSCQPHMSDYLASWKNANYNLWVRCYVALFTVYTIWVLLHALTSLQDALRSKYVFENVLGIPAHKLQGGAVDWETDVVQRLAHLQSSGQHILTLAGDDAQQQLDALVIAHRILRKENFLCALWNVGLLDTTVFGEAWMCASLEWSIHLCVLQYMFNHKYHVRPSFYLDSHSLARRFVICGIGHALFWPFLVWFSVLHFGLRNAYEFKSTRQYLGPREWSRVAKWTFGEFNELPHFYEQRIAPSYAAAQRYLSLFGQSDVLHAIGQILVFVGGSVGACLFVFAALNDAILLHVKIADWNLLWFAGMAGIVYSTGKSMLPAHVAPPPHTIRDDVDMTTVPRRGEDFVRNVYKARTDALNRVIQHTHYCPEWWRNRGWDPIIQKQFAKLFKPKAELFIQELVALILAPYILCVKLPAKASEICEFILATKTAVPHAGEVCGFATFDFDLFSDETWYGRTMGSDGKNVPNSDEQPKKSPGALTNSVAQVGVDEATKRFPKPKTRHGKMEKSFFTFKSCHPGWKCPESGQALVEDLKQYQAQERTKKQLQQQLHMEAAARQLETLARLEHERQESTPGETASSANQHTALLAAALKASRTAIPERLHQPTEIGAAQQSLQPLPGQIIPSSSNQPHSFSQSQQQNHQQEAYQKSNTADAGAGLRMSSTPTAHYPPPIHTIKPSETSVISQISTNTTHNDGARFQQMERSSFKLPNRSSSAGCESDDTAPFAVNASDSRASLSVSPIMMQRQSNRSSSAGAQSIHSSTSMSRGRTEHLLASNPTTPPNAASTTAAASLALSADILRLLNMSTLETGSLLNEPDYDALAGDRNNERQYMWLERYHEHIAEQKSTRQQHPEDGR